MLVIGLTGGIGCGKSLVSNLFQELFSTPVIDADVIAKQVSETKKVINKISEQLGNQFIDNNNQLNRKELRQAIFSDPQLKYKLEEIIHPLVYDEIKNQISKLDNDYCLVSIPLLLETKRTNFIDRILVVDCSADEQIARVMARDNCSKKHVEEIIATQLDRASRLSLADDIIENSDTIASVSDNVTLLHNQYSKLSRSFN